MESQPGCSHNWRLPQPMIEDSSDEEPETTVDCLVGDALVPVPIVRTEKDDDEEEGENEDEDSVQESDNEDELSRARRTNGKKLIVMLPRLQQERLLQVDVVPRTAEEASAILASLRNPNIRGPLADNDSYRQPECLAVTEQHLNVEFETRVKNGERFEDFAHFLGERPVKIISVSSIYSYSQVGFRMAPQRQEGNCPVFAYDHSVGYQKMHQAYLNVLNPDDYDALHQLMQKFHVEGLIESADYALRCEQYRDAQDVYEHIIIHLQKTVCGGFLLTDPIVKLPYYYYENRAFHVVIFKYLHLLTSRGYHRTALELAKLLINLDASDPLAMTFIIDTLALRAKEYRWLIEFVSEWLKTHHSVYLFNLKMSNALAHFLIAKRSRATHFGLADALLQETMTEYPWVVVELLKALSISLDNDQLRRSLFGKRFLRHSRQWKYERRDPFLDIAIRTYAKIAAARWRDPNVVHWLMRNVHIVIGKFDNNPAYKKCVEEVVTNISDAMKEICPVTIRRYLVLIRPMAKLITGRGDLDMELAHLAPNRPWNPSPPLNSLNRLDYKMTDINPRCFTDLFDLLTTMVPHVVPEELVLLRREDVARENAIGISLFNPEIAYFVADMLRDACLIDEEGYIPDQWNFTPIN